MLGTYLATYYYYSLYNVVPFGLLRILVIYTYIHEMCLYTCVCISMCVQFAHRRG